MPADLMYNDAYVQSVYNPQPLAPRPATAFCTRSRGSC